MAVDVLHALPEEQASPSDELELHFSKRVGGLLPARACPSLRKPAELLQLLAGTEEYQAEVIGSPLGRGRDHELPHKAGRRRSSQRNPPQSRSRRVHDGTVWGAAKRDQEPALEWAPGWAKLGWEGTVDLREDARPRLHKANPGRDGPAGASGERYVALRQDHGDVPPGLNRTHKVRPVPGMCAPGLDDGIDGDVELARHLGGASPSQVLDQLGRVGGFHHCNAR